MTADRGRAGSVLRSRAWFDNPENPDMTALYVERYLNYGLSLEELQSDRPITPAALIRGGIHALPCIGDGRQSGTSGSPSILNASPESAVGGGLALLRTGDRIRVDLKARRVDALVGEAELERRRVEGTALAVPPSQTPWQEIHREIVGQFDGGAVIESAVKYQRIAEQGLPRDSH